MRLLAVIVAVIVTVYVAMMLLMPAIADTLGG